jgi:hypothetical protein
MQAEHDNVTETCLCGMATACGHVMHKFFCHVLLSTN